MCWIELPNHAVSEEVRARIDADPTAIVLDPPHGGRARTWALVAAFVVGAVVGWLSRF